MSQCEADCSRAAYLASVTLASARFESKTYSESPILSNLLSDIGQF